MTRVRGRGYETFRCVKNQKKEKKLSYSPLFGGYFGVLPPPTNAR